MVVVMTLHQDKEPTWNTVHGFNIQAPACMLSMQVQYTQALFLSTHTYPALLLTAVRSLTPDFSKLFIRFSGIPHNPKPGLAHTKTKQVIHYMKKMYGTKESLKKGRNLKWYFHLNQRQGRSIHKKLPPTIRIHAQRKHKSFNIVINISNITMQEADMCLFLFSQA